MSNVGELNLSLEVSKSAAARLVKALVGFSASILFARLIGPQDFGGFFYLLAVITIIKTPFEAWMSSIKKRFSEAWSDPQELVGLTVLSIITMFSVGTVGAVLGGDFLVERTGLETAPLLGIVLFLPLLTYSSFQQLLAATGKVGLTNWIDTGRSVGTALFRFVLIVAGLGGAGMAYGLVGSSVLFVGISLAYFSQRPTVPSVKTIKSVYEHARYNVVSALSGSLYGQLDRLLLGEFLMTTQVGLYQVAYQLSIPGVFVGGSIGEALLPKVSNLSSRGEDVAEHLSNAISFASLLAIPVFFGSLVMPRKLVVTTFGSQYIGAEAYLVGLTLYRVIQTQSNIMMTAFNALDSPEINARVNLFTVVVNLVVGVGLVLQIGGVGVVISTVLTETLRYAVFAVTLHRRMPSVTLFPSLLRRQFVAGAAMSGVVWFLHQQVVIRSWIDITLLVSVGAAAYTLFLMAASRQFRTTVRGVLAPLIR